MTTFELLDYFNEKGIALWVKDGKLRYRVPKGALDAGLKEVEDNA